MSRCHLWKSKLEKTSKFLLIFAVMFAWVFASWPLIVSFAQQATSTPAVASLPQTPAVSSIRITIDSQESAKVDNQNLPITLPNGSGELELYALPDKCFSANLSEIKHNLLTPPYCDDPIGFAISRPEDYFWDFIQPTRVVIGFCEDKDIDCGESPDRFRIVFISDPIVPEPSQEREATSTAQISF